MKAQSGMTLIEVMVALVVFALAGLSVMQATPADPPHGADGGENPRRLARR